LPELFVAAAATDGKDKANSNTTITAHEMTEILRNLLSPFLVYPAKYYTLPFPGAPITKHWQRTSFIKGK
jgi:hypothetical protein